MMDALEFAKQRRRMCNSIKCLDCKLFEYSCTLGEYRATEEDDARIVEAVEKWAAEHPEETRQSKFLKMFPNAPFDERGILNVPPCVVDTSYGAEKHNANCCIGKPCDECRREFWLTPVED